MSMFYDLNLPEVGKEKLAARDRLRMSTRLGYSSVAIAHVAADRLTPKDRCAMASIDPLPPAKSEGAATQAVPIPKASGSGGGQSTPHQFSRLTFKCGEAGAAADSLEAGGSVPMTYDIVAVQPASERVFQQACQSLEVDLITLDLTESRLFILRNALVKAALKRGIFFEICYSGALLSDANRRTFFQNAASLCRETRGRGIVLSSGARDGFEMRDPHTLVNIACLFGMKEQQAYDAITSNPHAVVQHGQQRRRQGCFFTVAAPLIPSQPAFVPDIKHHTEPNVQSEATKRGDEDILLVLAGRMAQHASSSRAQMSRKRKHRSGTP
eukprot:jgi/Botrbrau1/2980/Bobra.0026s0043.1